MVDSRFFAFPSHWAKALDTRSGGHRLRCQVTEAPQHRLNRYLPNRTMQTCHPGSADQVSFSTRDDMLSTLPEVPPNHFLLFTNVHFIVFANCRPSAGTSPPERGCGAPAANPR